MRVPGRSRAVHADEGAANCTSASSLLGTLQQTRVGRAVIDIAFDITPLRDENWLAFRSSAFPSPRGRPSIGDGSYLVELFNEEWRKRQRTAVLKRPYR